MKNKLSFLILDIPLFALNYVYLIVCSHLLTKTEFGSLNSYLGSLSISFVIGMFIQIKISSQEKSLISTKEVIECLFFILCLCLGLSIFLGYNYTFFTFLLLTSSLHVLVSITRGISISNKQFQKYYKSLYVELFVKMLSILTLYLLSIKSLPIVAGTLPLGLFASLIYGSQSFHFLFEKRIFLPRKKISQFILVNQFFIFFFLASDLFYIEKYQSLISGQVSLAIRLSQIPLFVFLTFINFDIKKLKELVGITKTLKRYLPVLSFLFLSSTLFISLVGELFIGILFPSGYEQALDFYPNYSIYYFCMALIIALGTKEVFEKKYFYNTVLFVISLFPILIYPILGSELASILRAQSYLLPITIVFILIKDFYFNQSKKDIYAKK